MKENIDLTRNRMFNRRINQGSFRLWKSLSRIPWNIHAIHSDMELSETRSHLILLGNRKQREFLKLSNEEDSGEYCDRCGVYIINFPWSSQYGLCRKCSKEVIEQHKSKLPWVPDVILESTQPVFSPIRRNHARN